MQRLLLFVAVLGACAFDSQGIGAESSTGPGPAASTGTGEASGSTSTGADTTAAAPGSTSTSTSTTETSSGPSTESSSTGAPALPGSCADILAADRNASTGIHTIARPSDGVEIEVHCEMELDGGGWTLIGRSEPGGPSSRPFGWGQATGTVGDPNAPYSLNVVDVGLSFTEVLITRRDDYAIPVQNAYVIEVPEDFLEDYGDQALEHGRTRTVISACPSPSMLAWVGHTDEEDIFFLRDNGSEGDYGLTHRGFRLAYNDCNNGGELHEQQGALFVR